MRGLRDFIASNKAWLSPLLLSLLLLGGLMFVVSGPVDIPFLYR
jgi:hypothetical protein